MRGGSSIDIDIPTFINAMKKKETAFYVAPLKLLSLDTDVLYIDGGSVLTMKLTILKDGSGILSIGTLNNGASLSVRDTPTNTNYNITEDKKNEILKMIADSQNGIQN